MSTWAFGVDATHILFVPAPDHFLSAGDERFVTTGRAAFAKMPYGARHVRPIQWTRSVL